MSSNSRSRSCSKEGLGLDKTQVWVTGAYRVTDLKPVKFWRHGRTVVTAVSCIIFFYSYFIDNTHAIFYLLSMKNLTETVWSGLISNTEVLLYSEGIQITIQEVILAKNRE